MIRTRCLGVVDRIRGQIVGYHRVLVHHDGHNLNVLAVAGCHGRDAHQEADRGGHNQVPHGIYHCSPRLCYWQFRELEDQNPCVLHLVPFLQQLPLELEEVRPLLPVFDRAHENPEMSVGLQVSLVLGPS